MSPAKSTVRRSEALSRAKIVAAAVEILDEGGDDALTVRALSDRLSTGRGAVYHYVAGMDEVLAAAADEVIASVTGHPRNVTDPHVAMRELALGLFDAIDDHPWVGSQLAREPFQPAVLRIWKTLGALLAQRGLSGPTRSDAGSALANYIFGSAAQFAAGARRARNSAERKGRLQMLADAWTGVDDDPIVLEAASDLVDHDDRAQFLAGVDIFVMGIDALAGKAPR